MSAPPRVRFTTACVRAHPSTYDSRPLVKLANDTLCVCLIYASYNVQSQQQAVVDLLDDSWEEVRGAALSLLKALLQPTAATGRCADLQSFVAFAEGYDKVCCCTKVTCTTQYNTCYTQCAAINNLLLCSVHSASLVRHTSSNVRCVRSYHWYCQ
jgi:predicted anti-sigma-YlaC factor YlaD